MSGTTGATSSTGAGAGGSCVRESSDVRSSGGEELSGAVLHVRSVVEWDGTLARAPSALPLSRLV